LDFRDLFYVVVGNAVFLAFHIGMWRMRPSSNPRILLLVLLGLFGMGISSIMAVFFSKFDILRLFALLCSGLFFLVFYLFIYAGVARSVSLTLLSRFLSADTRIIGFDSITEEYLESSRFEDRIYLMEEAGLVSLVNGIVKLTPKGSALARCSKVAARLLGTGMVG